MKIIMKSEIIKEIRDDKSINCKPIFDTDGRLLQDTIRILRCGISKEMDSFVDRQTKKLV